MFLRVAITARSPAHRNAENLIVFISNSAQAFKMHITRGKQAFLAVFHFVTINAYLISAMSPCHTNMLLPSPLAARLDAQINNSFLSALLWHLKVKNS